MKKDKLLQHQLRRLNCLQEYYTKRGSFELSGGQVFFLRFSGIYQRAINRSLKRFVNSL